MKKLIALLLALLLLAGLAACGVSLPAAPDTTAAKEPAAETKNSAPAETKAPALQTDAPVTEPAPTAEPAPALPPFEELLAFDNDACSMKVTGLYEDSFWGFTVKAQFENKTEDQDLRFTVDKASVNGVTYDPLFFCELPAGKKANEEITFSNDELSGLIGVFTDIELTIRVYDANDWMADDTAKETFHIYPYGQDKATVLVREPQPTDTVLADTDDFSFTVIDVDPEGFWGYTVTIFIVNKTDVPLVFSAEDVAVNGFMCDPFFWETVEPGKVSFARMDWSSSELEDNGITDVEEIEFGLRVYNAEDIWADNYFQETLTLRP